MKRLVLLSLLFVLATACGRRDKGFMPERLLNEQEMIAIMTDVQIIEADINYQKTQEQEQKPDDTIKIVPKDYVRMSRDYYDQLFEHYGITDSIFAQNMRYYTERPEVLGRIMDSVMQRLTKEQSEPQRGDSQ
jgi:hypothetical protein